MPLASWHDRSTTMPAASSLLLADARRPSTRRRRGASASPSCVMDRGAAVKRNVLWECSANGSAGKVSFWQRCSVCAARHSDGFGELSHANVCSWSSISVTPIAMPCWPPHPSNFSCSDLAARPLVDPRPTPSARWRSVGKRWRWPCRVHVAWQHGRGCRSVPGTCRPAAACSTCSPRL